MSLTDNPANKWLFDQVADPQPAPAVEDLAEDGGMTRYTLHTYPRPDWLPNWKDKGAYRDHGDDLRAWAWEFLRRNQEYQADYAHYMSVPAYYPDGGGKTPKLQRGSYPADDDEMIYFDREPPAAKPSETYGEYVRRTGREPERLEPALLHKWGVAHLNDPATPWLKIEGGKEEVLPIWFAPDAEMPPYAMEDSHGMDYVAYHHGIDRTKQPHPWEWPGDEVYLRPTDARGAFLQVLAFDLEQPLPPQLLKAKAMLAAAVQELQEASEQPHAFEEPPKIATKAPKIDTGPFRDCLRVFDAVWTIGWKPKEIAAGVWPDKGNTMGENAGGTNAKRAIDKALELTQNRDTLRQLLQQSEYPREERQRRKKSR